MHDASKSEVTRLREQIALEYEAASRVFHDFTPTARHEYITKRQENIEACYHELIQHMTPQEAVAIIAEVEVTVHVPSSGNTS